MTIYNFIISSTYKIREVILNRLFLLSETLRRFVNACIITVKKPPATHRFLKKKLTSAINQLLIKNIQNKPTNFLKIAKKMISRFSYEEIGSQRIFSNSNYPFNTT